MGLFGGSSKSSSTTQYFDSSTNLNQTAGSGDFLASDKNNIAGGDIYNTGLSEDMVSNIFSGVNSQVDAILKNADKFYNNALGFVSDTIGTQSQNVAQTTSALANAYNSEAASFSNFKSYALYGLIGFIAWAYFSKMR